MSENKIGIGWLKNSIHQIDHFLQLLIHFNNRAALLVESVHTKSSESGFSISHARNAPSLIIGLRCRSDVSKFFSVHSSNLLPLSPCCSCGRRRFIFSAPAQQSGRRSLESEELMQQRLMWFATYVVPLYAIPEAHYESYHDLRTCVVWT